ncbi:MAG TPA: DUF4384 domain-containing protein [Terriglobales bacterium]|nr:DUF4384 domain-containing protein [Terriglobales bacterium]
MTSAALPVARAGAQVRTNFDVLAEQLVPHVEAAPGPLLFVGITDSAGNVSDLEQYLTQRLAAALTGTRRIRLTSETARETALREVKANLADVMDPKTVQAAGNLVGAAWLLKGVAFPRTSSTIVELQVQLVRTQTAEYWQMGTSVGVDSGLLQRRERPLVMKAAAPPSRPPLRLEMAVVASRRSGRGADQFLGQVREGDRLRSNDDLKIHFRTNADAYVYLIWVDTRGEASVQFPSRQAGRDNRVRGGQRYAVPQGDIEWFYLDNATGTETLYLIASYEPLTDLDALARQVERGQGAGMQQNLDRLFDDLRSRGVGGVREGPQVSVPTKGSAGPAHASFGLAEGYAQAVQRLSFRHDP